VGKTTLSVGEANEADAMAAETALFAGDGGAASEATLSRPEGLWLDAARGELLVADTGNGLVRRMALESGLVTTIAGSVTSSTQPSPTPTPATSVELSRPIGLAREGDELFVADAGDGPAAGRILSVDLAAQPPLLTLLFDASSPGSNTVERPAAIAAHRFDTGGRWLFVVDRGRKNAAAGPVVPSPRLLAINLTSGVVFRIIGKSLRNVFGLALREHGDGSIDLFVAADVGEPFTEFDPAACAFLGVCPPDLSNFEQNCFNGLDDDGDGLVDAADPDCAEPLHVQVLHYNLFEFDLVPFFLDTIFLTPSVAARCYKKFPVESAVFDITCTSSTPAVVSDVDFQGFAVDALTVDPTGRVLFVEPLTNKIHFFELDTTGTLVDVGTVAGADFSLALPFDGGNPLTTKLERPRAIAADELDNLYVVDTANNRVRRVWIGELLE
jgi:hypothetical protein